MEFGKEVSKCHEVTFLCPQQAVSKLEEETKDASVDIIPVKFSSEGYISKGFARASAVKRFDIVHTFKPMPDIFPSGFAAKFKGCKWVADLDDLEGSKGFNRNSVLWKKKVMDFFEWLVPKFADYVTVASKGLEEFYRKFNPFYISNGADPQVFQLAENSNNKPVVLFMGLFHPDIIDADIVVQAIAKVSEKYDTQLLMIGDGDDRPRIQNLAHKLNIDASFTGHIDDVSSVIRTADIGVISFRDNMLNKCKCPLRLYEYMSCGLPIVSTKVGEPAHVLKDGAGLLVDSNVESVSNGIIKLIEDKNLAKEISAEGRRLVEEKYNWQKLGEQLVEYYEKL